ncbi:MAG: hypothetical protein KBS65_04760 [Prevotella sp.]|nr:hypothetical protein [Candidatus Equicola stercoris]
MKKNFFRICIVLVCLSCTFNASAKNSQTGRPVWVLAHACNSHQSLMDALEDGANGVEIDIHSNDENKYIDWSVNHGMKFPYKEEYLDPVTRKARNEAEHRTNTNKCYVSLEEYLKFPEMEEISVLWLDIKNQNIEDIVIYVHSVLEKIYKDPSEIPYSIIYGKYYVEDLFHQMSSPTGESCCAIEWLRDNLWENEGTGLSREGSLNFTYSTLSLDDLQKKFDQYNFPKEQHLMTNGFGWPYFPVFYRGSEVHNTLIDAKERKESGTYCGRTGAWSMEQAHHGLQMLCSMEDCEEMSYDTECDLILIEGRNEFFPALIGLPGFDSESLRNFTSWFFDTDGYWYEYNNGNYRLAGQRDEDPFYG